ncbi:MFS transporter [Bacillus sp. KH172YL63]|uniref:MFS transporter n=1 Tax=Bacillus sp. KH172YL63 TaxID=2709784 RepID=UPI0013E42E36|nr:MFS transporter [Bacillus sp. KH172YL63]BCB04296.1 multidrug resistance protein [Bacillus sp. KH172YL63]
MDSSKKRSDLFALSSIPLVMTLGNSMLIPVLPQLQKELHISGFQSSLIITVYSIFAILCIPMAGFLSDRYGRKAILIPSLLIAGIGGLICGFASIIGSHTFLFVLLGRVIQGIGAAGAFPVVIPTVGDLYEDDNQITKGLGLIETSNTFGKVLSPIIGAILAAWIWFVPFFSIPVLTSLSILMIILFVKVPPKNREEHKQSIREFVHEVRIVLGREKNWIVSIFAIGMISMFVLFGFLYHLSTRLETAYAIGGILKGLYLAIPLLFLCMTSYITGKMIGKNKEKMKWVIVFGALISSIAFIPFLFNEGKWVMILLLSVAGIGLGALLPCLDALITEGIDKEHRGTITSIYSSMRFTGVALGPPVIALMAPVPIFITFIILGLFAALSGMFFIKFPASISHPEPAKK